MNYFEFFDPNLHKKWILGLEIQKTNCRIKISILEIPYVPVFRQNGNFLHFRPKFSAKKHFLGRNFINLSSDSELAPPRYYVYQFLVKVDNFKFFGLNLGKLPNCMWYFASSNVESVAESWMEVSARFSNTHLVTA